MPYLGVSQQYVHMAFIELEKAIWKEGVSLCLLCTAVHKQSSEP